MYVAVSAADSGSSNKANISNGHYKNLQPRSRDHKKTNQDPFAKKQILKRKQSSLSSHLDSIYFTTPTPVKPPKTIQTANNKN